MIRPAEDRDAAAVAAIYDHHARNGTATFDLEGPGAGSWVDKIAAINARGWPFLVEERDGRVVGYAYVTQFRDRPAYAHSCENSIYVAPDRMGEGIGRGLIEALKSAALASGFTQMLAVVGGGEPASIGLHTGMGFVERGRMVGVGRKFGRTLDTVYLQCDLEVQP